MIRDWQNGDIKTSGRQFVSGSNETSRSLFYRLRLFLGEYFLDVADGTPWFQSVLGKAPQDLAQVALKERILSSSRVVGIQSFDFETDRNQRRITVSANVVDTEGNSTSVNVDEELV